MLSNVIISRPGVVGKRPALRPVPSQAWRLVHVLTGLYHGPLQREKVQEADIHHCWAHRGSHFRVVLLVSQGT